MASPTRADVRAEFAGLLTANMTGAGRPLQAFHSYTIKDFGAEMPVGVLGSAGTERVPFTVGGSYPAYLLDLWFFVLYAEVDKKGALVLDAALQPVWTEQDSEAALDAIEASARQLIDDNQRGANWKAIEYAGPTTVDEIAVGDNSYRREHVPLRFRTF